MLLHHPADARYYGVATSILMDLNVTQLSLLTNNPDKIVAIEGPNKEIKVEKRVPMIPKAWRGEAGVEGKEVGEYLKTKVFLLFYFVSDIRFKKWDICWIYHRSRNSRDITVFEIVHYIAKLKRYKKKTDFKNSYHESTGIRQYHYIIYN